MESEEIIQKLERFLEEKAKLDTESCYFITKRLNEKYWEEIESNEESEIDSNDDEFDAVAEDEAEIEKEFSEDEAPKKIFKRPTIKIKK